MQCMNILEVSIITVPRKNMNKKITRVIMILIMRNFFKDKANSHGHYILMMKHTYLKLTTSSYKGISTAMMMMCPLYVCILCR